MPDVSPVGEATELARCKDAPAPAVMDPAAESSDHDRRVDADVPDVEGKWPVPFRIAFIMGSAGLLWGLIFLAIRALW